ncbi:MAG: hypothetical protein ACM3QZ_12435 [Solirubrobacterales bacterium]
MNPRLTEMSKEYALWKIREIESQIAHTTRDELKIMLQGDLLTWKRIVSYYIAPVNGKDNSTQEKPEK